MDYDVESFNCGLKMWYLTLSEFRHNLILYFGKIFAICFLVVLNECF